MSQSFRQCLGLNLLPSKYFGKPCAFGWVHGIAVPENNRRCLSIESFAVLTMKENNCFITAWVNLRNAVLFASSTRGDEAKMR